ncbi:MAG TPA: translation initiation factor IF-3 [Solirubrobacteraceae bacterium]|nr:translation initiation factor IF-3 [Solirubrobacteraceae bacterium]
MPVPRRFDRRPPERDLTRINERIRVPEVRLIDEDGTQLGVMRIEDALRHAQDRDLDLVEVAPEARPPVCRVLDYSKYKYEQAQKQKQARKHQQQITIREIKFRPKIAQHDYDTKKGHVERFLRHKDKVKVTIMFRGREVTHPERGVQILDRLAEELAEFGVVEQRPLHDGRNMTMMLGPSKAVLAGQYDRGAANGELAASAENGAEPVAAGAVALAEAPAVAAVAVAVAEPAAVEAPPAPEAVAPPEPEPEPEPAAPAPAAAKPRAAAAAKPKPKAPAKPKAAAPAKPKAAAPAEPKAAAPAKPKPKPAAKPNPAAGS